MFVVCSSSFEVCGVVYVMWCLDQRCVKEVGGLR